MSWNYVCKLLKVFAVRSQNTKNKDHNLIFQLGMFIWWWYESGALQIHDVFYGVFVI